MALKPKTRQLNSEEKKLSEAGVKRLQRYRKQIASKVKYYDYQLSDGLRNNYEEQYQKMLSIKKQINEDIFHTDIKIIELERQINEGVEIKLNIKQKTICSECGQEKN